EFDARTGQLRRGKSLIKLQQQPARVLALLTSRPGVVVTRQELTQTVWGSDTFVDFEQGLNFAIRHIRTALGDDADQPRYLQTLPKQGYRFIAKVESVAEEPARTSAASAVVTERDVAIPQPVRLRTWAAIGIAGVLLVIPMALRYGRAGA